MSSPQHINRVLEAVWRKRTPSEKWGAKFVDGTLVLAACAAGTPCGRTPPPIGAVLHSVNGVEVSTFADASAQLLGKDEARVVFLLPCATLLQKQTPEEPLGMAFAAVQTERPNPQRVLDGSAAARAGITPGARIVAVAGQVVKDVHAAIDAMRSPAAVAQLVAPAPGLLVAFLSPQSDFAQSSIIPDAVDAPQPSGMPPAQSAAAAAVKDSQRPLNAVSPPPPLVPGTEGSQFPPRPFHDVTLCIVKTAQHTTLGVTFNRATGQIHTISTAGQVYAALAKKMLTLPLAAATTSSTSGPATTLSTPSGSSAEVGVVHSHWLLNLFITHVGDQMVCYDGTRPQMAIAQLVARAGPEYTLRLQTAPFGAVEAAAEDSTAAAAVGGTGNTHTRTTLSATAGPAGGRQGEDGSGRQFNNDSNRRVGSSWSSSRPQDQQQDRTSAFGRGFRPHATPVLAPSPVPSVDFLVGEAVGTLSAQAQAAARAHLPQWLQLLKSGLVFDAKDLFDASNDTAARRPAVAAAPGDATPALAPDTGAVPAATVSAAAHSPPTSTSSAAPAGSDVGTPPSDAYPALRGATFCSPSLLFGGVRRLLAAGIPPTVVERICPFGDDSLHCLGWTRRCVVSLALVQEMPPVLGRGATAQEAAAAAAPPSSGIDSATATPVAVPAGNVRTLVGGGYGTLLHLPADVLAEDGAVLARKDTVVIATARAAVAQFLAAPTSPADGGGRCAVTGTMRLVASRLGARSSFLTLTQPANAATDGPSATTTELQSDSAVLALQATGTLPGLEDFILLVPSMTPQEGEDAGRAIQQQQVQPLFSYGAFAAPVVGGDVVASAVAFSPFAGRVRFASVTPCVADAPPLAVVDGAVEMDACKATSNPVPAADSQLAPGAPLLFHSRVSGIVLRAVAGVPPAASPPPPPPPHQPKKKAAAVVAAAPAVSTAVVAAGPRLQCFATTAIGTTRFRQVLRATVARR